MLSFLGRHCGCLLLIGHGENIRINCQSCDVMPLGHRVVLSSYPFAFARPLARADPWRFMRIRLERKLLLLMSKFTRTRDWVGKCMLDVKANSKQGDDK